MYRRQGCWGGFHFRSSFNLAKYNHNKSFHQQNRIQQDSYLKCESNTGFSFEKCYLTTTVGLKSMFSSTSSFINQNSTKSTERSGGTQSSFTQHSVLFLPFFSINDTPLFNLFHTMPGKKAFQGIDRYPLIATRYLVHMSF